MPRNAVTKHMLTIYMCTFAYTLYYTLSMTVRNLNSLCRDSLAQVKEKSSSSDTSCCAWKVHYSRKNLGFADPYKKPKLCRCAMHAETLPVPKTDFQLPVEVAVT